MPPSDMDGITTSVAIKIEVEAVRRVERCAWQMQLGTLNGDIPEGTFDDAIADYGSRDFKALAPGI